ncbi:hypothetical protein FQA39_LY00906 [Lamprigera yunnana]|nr:hypothetical protein FQA39_LY00906 [Lamprigera yunnana]
MINASFHEIYQLKVVFHQHFNKRFYTNGSKRLHRNAVPTEHLISVSETLQGTHEFLDTNTSQNANVGTININEVLENPKTVLQEIGLKNISQLTPCKKHLYGKVKYFYRKDKQTLPSKQNFKQCLFQAQTWHKQD